MPETAHIIAVGQHEECPKCNTRGTIRWSKNSGVVQCRKCGAKVEIVTLTKSALMQFLGGFLPEEGDCAPMVEKMIAHTEKLFAQEFLEDGSE